MRHFSIALPRTFGLTVLVLASAVTCSRADEADDKVAALVKEMGGKVMRSERDPGKPIILIDLAHSKKATDETLQQLAPLKNLVELSLPSSITDAGMKAVASHEKLSVLLIRNTRVTDEGMKELTTLQHLTMVALPAGITAKGYKHLKALKNLDRLLVTDPLVTDDLLHALAETNMLHLLPNATGEKGRVKSDGDVTIIHLGVTRVTDAGLSDLTRLNNLQYFIAPPSVSEKGLIELAKLPNLRELRLRAARELTPASLKELAPLKQLRLISLWNVTDETLLVLSKIELLHALDLANPAGPRAKSAKEVFAFNLNRKPVTDEGLKTLLPFTRMQTLDLSFTKVTDAAIKDLAAFEKLHTLDLTKTDVTDAAMKDVAALKSLQSLSVPETITDAGLNELKALKSLQVLRLNRAKVSEEKLKEFQTALPKCRVQR